MTSPFEQSTLTSPEDTHDLQNPELDPSQWGNVDFSKSLNLFQNTQENNTLPSRTEVDQQQEQEKQEQIQSYETQRQKLALSPDDQALFNRMCGGNSLDETPNFGYLFDHPDQQLFTKLDRPEEPTEGDIENLDSPLENKPELIAPAQNNISLTDPTEFQTVDTISEENQSISGEEACKIGPKSPVTPCYHDLLVAMEHPDQLHALLDQYRQYEEELLTHLHFGDVLQHFLTSTEDEVTIGSMNSFILHTFFKNYLTENKDLDLDKLQEHGNQTFTFFDQETTFRDFFLQLATSPDPQSQLSTLLHHEQDKIDQLSGFHLQNLSLGTNPFYPKALKGILKGYLDKNGALNFRKVYEDRNLPFITTDEKTYSLSDFLQELQHGNMDTCHTLIQAADEPLAINQLRKQNKTDLESIKSGEKFFQLFKQFLDPKSPEGQLFSSHQEFYQQLFQNSSFQKNYLQPYLENIGTDFHLLSFLSFWTDVTSDQLERWNQQDFTQEELTKCQEAVLFCQQIRPFFQPDFFQAYRDTLVNISFGTNNTTDTDLFNTILLSYTPPIKEGGTPPFLTHFMNKTFHGVTSFFREKGPITYAYTTAGSLKMGDGRTIIDKQQGTNEKLHYQLKEFNQKHTDTDSRSAISEHLRENQFNSNTLQKKYYDACIRIIDRHTPLQGCTDEILNFQNFGSLDVEQCLNIDKIREKIRDYSSSDQTQIIMDLQDDLNELFTSIRNKEEKNLETKSINIESTIHQELIGHIFDQIGTYLKDDPHTRDFSLQDQEGITLSNENGTQFLTIQGILNGVPCKFQYNFSTGEVMMNSAFISKDQSFIFNNEEATLSLFQLAPFSQLKTECINALPPDQKLLPAIHHFFVDHKVEMNHTGLDNLRTSTAKNTLFSSIVDIFHNHHQTKIHEIKEHDQPRLYQFLKTLDDTIHSPEDAIALNEVVQDLFKTTKMSEGGFSSEEIQHSENPLAKSPLLKALFNHNKIKDDQEHFGTQHDNNNSITLFLTHFIEPATSTSPSHFRTQKLQDFLTIVKQENKDKISSYEQHLLGKPAHGFPQGDPLFQSSPLTRRYTSHKAS